MNIFRIEVGRLVESAQMRANAIVAKVAIQKMGKIDEIEQLGEMKQLAALPGIPATVIAA